VLWQAPITGGRERRLALWVPWLTGSKEKVSPFLELLADAGFLAVSFDPWQHGERGSQTPDELMDRVFGRFRAAMWPILGQSTLEAMRVVDWAIAELGPVTDVVAGGVSMGGDIAVALAEADPRVSRVATVGSTPDWTRPGMRALDGGGLVDQGDAGTYAQWLRAHLNPIEHLENYRRAPAIAFECGGDDDHVPPAGAVAFRDALAGVSPEAAGQVRVTVHPGLDHFAVTGDPAVADRCVEWLRA